MKVIDIVLRFRTRFFVFIPIACVLFVRGDRNVRFEVVQLFVLPNFIL